MSDNTPIWLLDVDGVLNPFSSYLPSHYTVGSAARYPGERANRVSWDPTIIGRIKQLHEDDAVEIQWLTTWGAGANGELRELFGFDRFELAADPPSWAWRGWSSYSNKPHPQWWKLGAVKQLLDKDPSRRVVWTDDEIGLEPDALDLVKTSNVFAVSPAPQEGLSLTDMSRIEQFVKGRQTPGLRMHGKTLW